MRNAAYSNDDYAISKIYCPSCWGNLQFLPKTTFFKLFMTGKRYRCINCRKEYLQIFNRLLEL